MSEEAGLSLERRYACFWRGSRRKGRVSDVEGGKCQIGFPFVTRHFAYEHYGGKRNDKIDNQRRKLYG